MTKSGMTSVSSRLFDTFANAPDAWRDICAPDDLAMDLKVLDVTQRTLADQCRCWGLIVFDNAGVAIGCAALCLFDTELIETSHPVVIRWRKRLRSIWPRFGKMRVLFCGLPVPSGSTHLRVKQGAPAQAVIEEVDRVMQSLAGDTKARLLVFKELGKTSEPFTTILNGMGYIKGPIPPMHLLNFFFRDFEAYRAALKSRYRAQVQRSQKKLKAAGFEVISGRGKDFFAAYYEDYVHALYIEVQKRAAQKLELMPPSFFSELAKALDDEVLLTVIRRNGKICAFTFAITRGGTHYNMYSGLDYTLNSEGDLYFNLFYHDMDKALSSGATSLHLGQTSDAFKSRLGSSTEKLFFFARAHSKLMHGILRRVSRLAFPKVADVEPHDVFTSPGKVPAKKR